MFKNVRVCYGEVCLNFPAFYQYGKIAPLPGPVRKPPFFSNSILP
jgi:hypothetical protein